MTAAPLTKRQRDVLTVIEDTVARNGVPPSVREIADALSLRSTGNVLRALNRLEERGAILRLHRRARGISIPDLNALTITLRPAVRRAFLEACRAENVRPEIKAAEIISQWCGER